jgi:hypothetical protein
MRTLAHISTVLLLLEGLTQSFAFVTTTSPWLPTITITSLYAKSKGTPPLKGITNKLQQTKNTVKKKVQEEIKENTKPGLSRRQVIEVAVATTGIGISVAGTREVRPTDYGLWGVLPVGTYKSKKTIRETIVPNQVWTLDQKFGILNVQVPLRMTLLKLSTGGLLVYSPIAATPECLQLVNEIVQEHGPIRHIILGSVALEHKNYAAVFAQKFPQAQVWLQPGQYTYPINLPDSFVGFPLGRTHRMPRTMADAPAEWQADLDFATLGPIISRDGAFGETVVLHKPTKTLLVTDTAVQATEDVPAIYDHDPAPLLYHARDTVTDIVTNTPDTLRKGWRRVVQFGLFFTPSAITIKDAGTALRERRPDINSDFAGVYPWDWDGNEEASWKALTGSGRGGPLVSPILQVLLLVRTDRLYNARILYVQVYIPVEHVLWSLQKCIRIPILLTLSSF